MSQANILQFSSLLVLTLQASAAVLAMRLSYKQTEGGKDVYAATTLILVFELMKFAFCLIILLVQKSGSLPQLFSTVYSQVICKPQETAKLSIPSFMYIMQNNLVLIALSHLDAATFQITDQLKILMTAIFSVLLLKKKIRPLQWVALVILMSGVIVVQLKLQYASVEKLPQNNNIATNSSHTHLIGVLAVMASSTSSGFTGVYYEKLLKESAQPSIIIRNIQLGFFSLCFGVAGVLVKDLAKVVERGFFFGWNPVVWLVAFLQAFGGLIIAAVMKFAGNILKCFATSFSIILSCLFSSAVFHDLDLDLLFAFGTGLVISASVLYGLQSQSSTVNSSSSVDETVTTDTNDTKNLSSCTIKTYS